MATMLSLGFRAFWGKGPEYSAGEVEQKPSPERLKPHCNLTLSPQPDMPHKTLV